MLIAISMCIFLIEAQIPVPVPFPGVKCGLSNVLVLVTMILLDRKSAAKFSFMMSAPAIVGSLLFEGKDALENGYFAQLELVPTLIGMVTAAVCGYLAIRFMLKLINKLSLNWFALYTALLGLIILLLQLSGFTGLPAFALPGTMPIG